MELKFKIGDWVVIQYSGWGTNPKDVGLVCKIVKTNVRGCYNIEIDRDKIGNGNRFTCKEALRYAKNHEIPEEFRNKETEFNIWN